MATANTYQYPEIAQRRADVLADGVSPADILNADDAKLLTLQFRLGYGSEWGVIAIPEEFMPDGAMRTESARIIRIKQFLPDEVPYNGAEASHAWREIMRFAVTRSLIPGIRRRSVIQPSTLASELVYLKPCVQEILKRNNRKGAFWSRLIHADVLAGRSEKHLLPFINTISHYHTLGYLPDCFSLSPTVQGDEPERDRTGEPEHTAKANDDKQYQPFPDQFTSEMGWRSLKIIKNLGPTLLSALEAALEVQVNPTNVKTGKPLTSEILKSRKTPLRNAVIADWNWVSDDGSQFRELVFDIYLKPAAAGLGNASKPKFHWPPATFMDALKLSETLLQPAHMFVVLLANGSRNSEAVSLTESCLIEAPGGNYRWKGKTYKMTGAIGGRDTDATVPETVTQAIVQQIRLASIYRRRNGKDSDKYLWGGIKGKKKLSLNKGLNRYTKALGLEHLLTPENPSCHVHRFRKTLARMVALIVDPNNQTVN